VDILDADGQRLTLSVWSYPLAGASTAAAAPRKNSAVSQSTKRQIEFFD